MQKIFVLVLLTATAVFAEISPKYYIEMQQKSAERLRIRVEKVQNGLCVLCETYTTRVHAIIMRVGKSAAELKIGNKVFFEYEIFVPKRGWAGPRPMPLLTEGNEYDFFGAKVDVTKDKGIVLSPGARGYSFESLIGD